MVNVKKKKFQAWFSLLPSLVHFGNNTLVPVTREMLDSGGLTMIVDDNGI